MIESTGSGIISGNELLKKEQQNCNKKYFIDWKLNIETEKPMIILNKNKNTVG